MKRILFAALLLALASVASAQAASASATATATVQTQIAISAINSSWNFGSFTSGPTAGSVNMSAVGDRGPSGGVNLTGPALGQPASYQVTGSGNATFSITLPTTVTLTGPGTAMTIDTITHNAGASPALSSGSKSFALAGTLNVGANQLAGTYTSSSFNVTVAYN